MCGAWEEGLSGSLLLFLLTMCVVHDCDVLNKRDFARLYMLSEHMLSEHTLVITWRYSVLSVSRLATRIVVAT